MRRIISACFFCFAVLISCKKEVQNNDSEKSDLKKDSSIISVNSIKNVQEKTENKPYRKFSGAWFDIDYPSNFTADDSMKSLTNTQGFDSAVFTSPDGKVQFYVFSPQWKGKPTDIELKSDTEKLIFSHENKEDGITMKEWKIEAKDKSYFRWYQEITSEDGLNKIFGMKYPTESDYKTYEEQFNYFKNSLKQYAD